MAALVHSRLWGDSSPERSARSLRGRLRHLPGTAPVVLPGGFETGWFAWAGTG